MVAVDYPAGTDVAPDVPIWESETNGCDPNNTAHLRDGLELTFARRGQSDRLQLVLDAQNTEWGSALMGALVSAHGSLTGPGYDPGASPAASAPIVQALDHLLTAQFTIGRGGSVRYSTRTGRLV